ncbi:MAG: molybdopterin molybdotransferase MoeA [Saprospiraceae bacterium]
MITVSEAKNLILKHSLGYRYKTVDLLSSLNYVLSESVYSEIDSPPFHQSAMDGYAFSFNEWDKKSPLTIMGEVQAGNSFDSVISGNQTVRIFTGATMPIGTDTVVVQEKISKVETKLFIEDPNIQYGVNVRLQGSQIKKVELALAKDTLMTAAATSYLAALGVTTVEIYSNPKIGLIITGKELVAAGNLLNEGQIYESNSIALLACLQQMSIVPESVEIIDDNEEALSIAIQKVLGLDIIILTGGVSVGDYDLVPSALENNKVEKIFHKVKQKPGKPFLFGKYKQTLIFALPGNPAAVLTCFYQYIVPAISAFTRKQYFENFTLPLAENYKKKSGLCYFLKGKIENQKAYILENQESYLLNSFALANCLIELDEEQEEFPKGELVKVLKIV